MNRTDLLAIMAAVIYTDRLTAPVCTPAWAVDEAEKLLAEVERRAARPAEKEQR